MKDGRDLHILIGHGERCTSDTWSMMKLGEVHFEQKQICLILGETGQEAERTGVTTDKSLCLRRNSDTWEEHKLMFSICLMK